MNPAQPERENLPPNDVGSVPTAGPSRSQAETQFSKIPVAIRVPRQGLGAQILLAAGWVLLLAASAGLIFAAWTQLRQESLIVVYFQDGHGINPGDPLRHRGIVVGAVRSIVLDSRRDLVKVVISIPRVTEHLARVGTRFWIERPAVSAASIRGLETLVEGRYVAIDPGPKEAPLQREFDGLEEAPLAGHLPADALDVVLECDDRYHLKVGTPVTYRGIQVGRVAAVNLASDGLAVESRLVIDVEYHNLVRVGTEFWVKYPMDFHLGFGGMDLNLGTLETLAAGGVAFATPTSAGAPVRTGHRFTLRAEEPNKWREWRPQLVVGRVTLADGSQLPQLVRVVRVTPTTRFGMRREQRTASWLLPLSNHQVLGPATLLRRDAPGVKDQGVDGESADAPWLELAGSKVLPPLEPVGDATEASEAIAIVGLGEVNPELGNGWSIDALRAPLEPEDCLLISGLEGRVLPIGVGRLRADNHRWWLDRRPSIADEWEGAVALSRKDGKIIGQVGMDDGMAFIGILTVGQASGRPAVLTK